MSVAPLDRLHTVRETERLDPGGTEQYRYQPPRRALPIAPAIDRM